MAEKIILAGIMHGIARMPNKPSWLVARRTKHAKALLSQLALRSPGATIGLETSASHSIFRVVAEGIRNYDDSSPFIEGRRKIVAYELSKRLYLPPNLSSKDAVARLAEFKTMGEFRNAVEQGRFSPFEAIHLHAEDLGLKVEPVDPTELRKRASEAAIQIKETRQRALSTEAINVGEEYARLRKAFAAIKTTRSNYMAEHARQHRLPLYLVGTGHAVDMHRALKRKLPVKLVKIRFAWKPTL